MSQFTENDHPRAADGRFAEKPPAPEAAGLDLADPESEAIPTSSYGDVGKDERVKAMLADLHRDVGDLVESGKVERYLDAISSNGLSKWSLNNRHLALAQLASKKQVRNWDEFMDTAENAHMMGFKQWQERDASVKKGEKAVWILAPMARKRKETKPDGSEEERTYISGFRAVPVYDVSQCEGPGTQIEQHPSVMAEGDVPPGTIEGLRKRIEDRGYSVREEEIPGFNPTTGSGTLGYTTADGSKEVVVDSRLSELQKASTYAHELGHIECGHVDGDYAEYRQHRGEMEAEAETCAYMTLRSRGVDPEPLRSFSPGYIAVWAQGDNEKITKAMGKGVKAHSEIMKGDWPQT